MHLLQNLVAHIERRACKSLKKLVLLLEDFTEAKVGYLSFSIVDQYILQFKIPVHNHQADDLLESINDL
jgi:hypothetical protein